MPKLSPVARRLLETGELLISPMVVIEMGLLSEIGRIRVSPQTITAKLNAELGVAICDHPFPAIAAMALHETWTRDPFDRVIVAHARANGSALLITSDTRIRAHYPGARW